MKYIPLLQTDQFRNSKQIADLFTDLNTDKRTVSSAYILDTAGIKKNRPSLSFHQYAHRWFDTIVDAGCHHVGDVVDVLLAGADIMVLRPGIWQEIDFRSIRDISESKIYVWFNPLQVNRNKKDVSLLFSNADGIIFNLDRLSNPLSFGIRDKIKTMISSYPVDNILIFDPMKKHEKEWGLFDLETVIVDSAQMVDSL
ncbi:MAG: hypothetical protein KGY65_07485 [Candidatus Thermoplasmatota archaeon]|nr:hypothetical protein [Candidatus Thermoplasmatota archaeon]MBS3802574.1 hypothetical protein [Candidatus Thermoplasmatota archaeon]